MNWFLGLFPQYRHLVQNLRETADNCIRLQDQNDTLMRQNVRLEEEISRARDIESHSIKSVANVFAQLNGHLPPYSEAYSIQRRPESADAGPVPTNRLHGRDAVRQGREEFRQQLFASDMQVEPQAETN